MLRVMVTAHSPVLVMKESAAIVFTNTRIFPCVPPVTAFLGILRVGLSQQ